MFEQRRWPPEGIIPTISGVMWLWYAASFGVVGFMFSIIPGCLLVAAGVSMLLWPGDRRITQFSAVGGMLGVPFSLPVYLVAGFGVGLLLTALSIASFLSGGAASVRQEPHTDGVPMPEPSLALWGKVALDDALLSTMVVTIPLVGIGRHRQIADEITSAWKFFSERGWLEKPEDYHRAPPALETPRISSRRVTGIDFEHLSFESGYAPHPEEPGRERWLGYEKNRTAHAWMLRRNDRPRPWLVGIHGFQIGYPQVDLRLFREFHDRYGMNILLPVLPLHGPRTEGRRSGDGFISGEYLDTVHALANGMWDMRRMLSWIRTQDATSIGVYGLSLGGYNASLLSCLDEDLACVIAGIPLTCFARASWRHGPPLWLRYAEYDGLSRPDVEQVLSVVSPLTLETKVAQDRRYIFGGVADRLVPPDQVQDLWLHWDQPRIAWYQGSHMTFMTEPSVRKLIRDAVTESGLAAS